MSLLSLVHKNVIIKFTDFAKDQFNPEASYVFRLTGVDAMGFLLIQDLKPDGEAGPEVTSEPYWINKDLVRELHELNLATAKGPLFYHGQASKPAKASTGSEAVAKPAKAKIPAKKKVVLS